MTCILHTLDYINMELWQYILILILSFYILNLRKYFVRPKFNGLTVWITGASSGIGEHLAYEFARTGANLVLSARNKSELDRVAFNSREIMKNSHQDIKVIPLDLTEFDESIKIVRENLKDVNIDILVNNAGMSQRTLCIETVDSLDVEKRIINLNFLGTVAMTKALLPHFVNKKSGQIVNINSVAGLVGSPLRTAYSASKFALKGYMEALRAELAEYNIFVTDIYPGFIQTNLSKNALAADGGKFGKTDNDIATGMPASEFARKAIYSIYTKEKESTIAELKLHLAIFIKKVSASLYSQLLTKASKQTLAFRDQAK